MGKVEGRADRLKLVGEFRAILDGMATGDMLPAYGYERLRRRLLRDTELRPYLPAWLDEVRTTDDARAFVTSVRDPRALVRRELNAIESFVEDREFNPRRKRELAEMHCPYCTVAMSPDRSGMGRSSNMFYNDKDGGSHGVQAGTCPECKGVFLTHYDMTFEDGNEPGTVFTRESREYVLLPRMSSGPPVPPEVPEPFASLAREAGLILGDSPRASAAMSRRCLQQLLRDKAGAPPSDLHKEVKWVIENENLPGDLQDGLHDLRTIGNMAAHPNKSTATGDYLEVEPGEAEWSLDVLDGLFDFYFVRPAKSAARKAALDARLGKGPAA